MEGVQKKLGGKLLKRYHKNWERMDGVHPSSMGLVRFLPLEAWNPTMGMSTK